MNDMRKFRNFMIAIQALTCSFVLIWIYASYRYDGFNVRGGKGDVNAWDDMLSVGAYGAAAGWAVSILIAIIGAYRQRFKTNGEKIFWLIFSLVSAPVLTFLLSTITS